MPKAHVNDIDLEYETYGSPDGEPLLLIGGLGAQLTRWSQPFLDALVSRGFHVIVFDNRDVGFSTKFGDWGPADIPKAFAQARAKEIVDAPYNLDDLTDDAAGLLTALDIDQAHVLGSSNGGAMAQIMAIRYPSRVATMISVSATSGRRRLARPSKEADAWLNRPRNPAGTREGAMDEVVDTLRIIGSPAYPQNEERAREHAARDYDRCFYPEGNSRHLLASISSGDSRVPELGKITAPTLVIHGAQDPLIPLGCGEDIKNSIPGAEMLVIDGMGHDYPDEVVDRMADAIRQNALRCPVRAIAS
jgi:proline iminopeptidase